MGFGLGLGVGVEVGLEVAHPVGLLVVGDKLVLDRLDVDEGAGDGAVDKRRVRAPAEGVGVVDHADAHLVRVGVRVGVGVRTREKG